MDLVADANILFALANPKSQASKLINECRISLFSLDYALAELLKYKEEIEKKSGGELKEIIYYLKQKITIIPVKTIKDEITRCKPLISDQADFAYLALSLYLKIPIWSNDNHLKEQSMVPILSTKELIELFS